MTTGRTRWLRWLPRPTGWHVAAALGVALILGGSIMPPVVARAASVVVDLGVGIPDVPESHLQIDPKSGCGVAAATMVLDYYEAVDGAAGQGSLDINAVGQYVPVKHDGTRIDQLQTGIESAGAEFGIPVVATYGQTSGDPTRSASNEPWFGMLTAELQRGHPVIVFLPNGGSLWSGVFAYGHFVVVTGYASDNSIIYHDPFESGGAHETSAAAFGKVWGTTWNGNTPWWYVTVTPAAGAASTAAPTSAANPTAIPASTPTATSTQAPPSPAIPGGLWIAPASGAMISGTTLHFAAHAYPTHPGDPPIDHVNFTIWWPALGPQSGPWKLACPAFSPGGDLSIGASDVYACDADLAALGAPPGSLLVSFDVYDTAGDRNLAPNGEHRIVWSPPVTPAPTVMLSPPAPPTGVSVTNAGPGALLVTWTAPAGDVSGYRLRVFTDFLCDPTPCGSQLQQTYTVGPTVTSYAVGGLDGMYCFDVSAFNAAGDSSPSDRTCGGTNPFPPIPTQAWSVTLTAGTTSAIVGEVVPLSAVASHSLTGTGYHIEIRHAYTDQPYQVCALEVSPCTYQLTWPMQGGTDVYAALLDGTTVIASSTPFWIIFANPG
jgi:hypothetical protein